MLVPGSKLPEIAVRVWFPLPPALYEAVIPSFVMLVDWPASSVLALAVEVGVAVMLTAFSDPVLLRPSVDAITTVDVLDVVVVVLGAGGSSRRWI